MNKNHNEHVTINAFVGERIALSCGNKYEIEYNKVFSNGEIVHSKSPSIVSFKNEFRNQCLA